jgi:RND family efflux transporter MFP subunit
MRLLTRILLPILVLVGAGSIAFITVANKVEPERRAPRVALMRVEFVSLAPSDFEVWVKSRGTVRPRTESTLLPEVSGSITELSTKFRAGEFFEPGDVLLRIDPRNYQSEVTVAEASLAQARAALAEEQARSAQAQREWKRLGEKGVVDDLVLRKPQLAGAQAQVRSAQAGLARSRLNLERTVIRAPYAGRVLQQNVDVGQYVSPGTTLARVYAVEYAEVRLPLSNRQLDFVDVPEIYRDESPAERAPGAALELTARIGSRIHTWRGQVVRAEGAIDTQSRQIFVIGQIEDPYGKTNEGRPPLKVGQFVEARIRGRTLRGVYVIPRSALRAGAQVHTLDAADRVRSRVVEIVYSDEQHAVVSKGLSPQERLVITALGAGMEGQQVKPASAGNKADTSGAPGERGERRRTRRGQSKAAAL